MILPSLTRMIPGVGPTIIPGSISYTTPGTYSFTFPHHHTLLADVRGASGGGGGISVGGPYSTDGTAGGYSGFNAQTGNLVGYGGGGGGLGRNWYTEEDGDMGVVGANGANGTGVNGDYNGTGDATTGGLSALKTGYNTAGNGGNGARAYRTWVKGSLLVPLSVITVVVGTRGSPGASYDGGTGLDRASQYGVDGAVYISWT